VVTESPERQARSHRAGLRRLVTLDTPDPTRWVVAHLGNADKLALGASPYPGISALLADARLAAVGELIARSGQDPRDAGAYARLRDAVRAETAELMRAMVGLAAEILREWQAVRVELPRVEPVSAAAAVDLTEQVGNLVFPGFVAATPYERLVDLPRYLQAAGRRITALAGNPARDAAGLVVISRCEDAYAALVDRVPPGPLPDFVAEVGWLLEELRVSLFAQPIRTKVPVSEKRVRAAIDAASRRL